MVKEQTIYSFIAKPKNRDDFLYFDKTKALVTVIITNMINQEVLVIVIVASIKVVEVLSTTVGRLLAV